MQATIPSPAPIVIENPLPSGPTISVNIPPAEEQHVPPEERSYGFSIKGGTYDQLVEGFARQTGLGVLGDVPKDGSVNFVTTEKLSFREALGRVRMLLFNYKPLEPYWLLRNEGNLQVIRVTDLYRIIPRDRVFQSVDEYRRESAQRRDRWFLPRSRAGHCPIFRRSVTSCRITFGSRLWTRGEWRSSPWSRTSNVIWSSFRC